MAAIGSDMIRDLRAEALAWINNTSEHPVSNAVVALLCTEILIGRGEE